MLLPYNIVLSEAVPYDVLGLDRDKIRSGDIPTEKEFTDAVRDTFKKLQKPFKGKSREEFYDSEVWKQFQRDVRAIYKDMGSVATGDAPVKRMDIRIDQIAKEMAAVKGLLKAREELAGKLRSNPDKAREVLEEALEKTTKTALLPKNVIPKSKEDEEEEESA